MLATKHKQLEGHFRELSRERAPLGYPVYAFEHGLEPEELQAIRQALCAELLSARHLNREHWLLWTVIAAEIGYTYNGDEYWYSFESEIPDWVSFGSREAVRDWFRDFTSHFTGFQPSGRWANHFSIIAWPITHSILPRYLQSHFARHLYELRHDLAAEDDSSIDQLGKLLDRRYHGGSSRFENFLQQTALTARLVLALRDEDVQGSVTPIYRPTLARIVRDLERKGASRGYLHDARRVLRDARLKARSGLGGPSRAPQPGTASDAARVIPPGLKLIARCNHDETWQVGVGLPNIPALIAQTGVTAGALDKTRMSFVDRPDTWMPGRALVSYSGHNHALNALPDPLESPVVLFKDTSGPMTAFATHFKILSRSPWLLRVHEDGTARQVLGNHIRTGEDYLVITSAQIASDIVNSLKLNSVVSKTRGIELYRLAAPRIANPYFIKALSKLGLGYALRAHVKPFGLVPRWDSSLSSSVWLPSEDVLLHLSADFDVSEFSLSVNSEAKTRISVREKKEVIVSLGRPSIGRYVVEIGATAVGSERGTKVLRPVSPEFVLIEVRAPIPWQQGIRDYAGLRVVIEPDDASFEDLLAKRASIAIHGPQERTAVVEARLYDTTGHLAQSTEIGRVVVPSSESALARTIEKLANDPLSEAIQSAARVELAFVVEELGAASISFPHKVAPLRWKLEPHDGGSTIRLIDEAGVTGKLMVDRYNMAMPDQRIELEPTACVQGIPIEAPGALFIARFDGRMYGAFASILPKGRLTAFSDLAVNISLAVPGDSARKITRLLAMLRIWRVGRPLGSLATIRKAKVLEVLERQIERLACGQKWAEKAYRFRSAHIAIEHLQSDVGGSPGFASRMRTTEWTWSSDRARARSEFFRLAKTYNVSDNEELCDLALRLAFHPTTIRLDNPKNGAELFEALGANGILARGAFFAKITSDLRFLETAVQLSEVK